MIRSPTIFAGYFSDLEATAAVLDDGGCSARATSRRSTTTASSRSTDRRRTSSSRPAARTSLRRTENDLEDVALRPWALRRRRLEAVSGWALIDSSTRPSSPRGRPARPRRRPRGARPQRAGAGAGAGVVVDDVNRERSRFEQLKRFADALQDFTIEGGELDSTLKVRRRGDRTLRRRDRGAVRRIRARGPDGRLQNAASGRPRCSRTRSRTGSRP